MREKVTLAQYAKEMRDLPRKLREASRDAIREGLAAGVLTVVEEIEHAGAVSSGAMRQSVRYEDTIGGGTLYVDSPHAAFVNDGTRPHWPPPEPIFEWVMRKGIAKNEQEAMDITFLIQRHIATYGTAPTKFFDKAMVIVKKDIKKRIKNKLAKLR